MGSGKHRSEAGLQGLWVQTCSNSEKECRSKLRGGSSWDLRWKVGLFLLVSCVREFRLQEKSLWGRSFSWMESLSEICRLFLRGPFPSGRLRGKAAAPC